jgi:hypothetical protein
MLRLVAIAGLLVLASPSLASANDNILGGYRFWVPDGSIVKNKAKDTMWFRHGQMNVIVETMPIRDREGALYLERLWIQEMVGPDGPLVAINPRKDVWIKVNNIDAHVIAYEGTRRDDAGHRREIHRATYVDPRGQGLHIQVNYSPGANPTERSYAQRIIESVVRVLVQIVPAPPGTTIPPPPPK